MQLEIKNLSNLGHGIAFDEKNNKIFVPKSVSGDVVEAQILKKNNKFIIAKIKNILTESQFRVVPPCEYFSRCGGCSLQHLDGNFYLNFKKQNILNLFKSYDIPLNNEIEFIEIGAHSRRRASFHVTNNSDLGFFEENSNDLVKINHCLMLEPEMEKLIPALQTLVRKLPAKLVKTISLCAFDNIIDVILVLQKADFDLRLTQVLSDFAKNNSHINLSYKVQNNVTPLFIRSKPQMILENIKIDLPNNIFLQATRKGQNAIISKIVEFAKNNKIKNAVDLYSGIGSYSFSLLDYVEKIVSFEGEEIMVKSINDNAKKHILTHKISAKTRDLVSNPVPKEELKNFDLAIINPPRNGSQAQILKLVESEIKNIIVVSCDFNSFIKDAKILVENGFQLNKLSAIDQFYYTAHIELVAIFQK